jgi:hypothetical protein
LGNWGGVFNSQTIAAEAKRIGKRCILLWMAGGASHLDTFDMKPGRAIAGPFRQIKTNVDGLQICEYLPNIAKMCDKLAVIRSMQTNDPGHAPATYLMHCGYKAEASFKHPELGAMAAKYLGSPDADLPSFVQLGQNSGESSPTAGAGFLGPAYAPFRLGSEAKLPENTSPYAAKDADQRRNDLLKFMDDGFGTEGYKAQELAAHRSAQERSQRLIKARSVFDVSAEWSKERDRYGDTKFGKNCLAARKLIESGVSFVEVEQPNYDSHADNFEWHKALLPVLDKAWSALMTDLEERGLLKDTLVVWLGEFGRTPTINNRAGRDHYAKAWTVCLAGGGVKGGIVHGKTDEDGRIVVENPVSEGDLFATIYTTLGINPRAKHYVGSRPVWATPEKAGAVKQLLV